MNETDPELEAVVKAQNLDDKSAAALTQIALDPHGMEREDAPSLLASLNHCSISESTAALINLLSKQLVVEMPGNRLAVDFQRLGIGDELRSKLQVQPRVYEDLDNPHAPQAMATLAQIFDQEGNTIYLCMEITSPIVFKRLSARAGSGRKTVFLIPKKEHVRTERAQHYDEVLAEWKQLITSTAALKNNTEIRVMASANPALYTSALTASSARFDLYRYNMQTTRAGRLIRMEKETSLYDAVWALYRDAYVRSVPLFRIWPFRWFVVHTRRFWVLVLALLCSVGLEHFTQSMQLLLFLMGFGTSFVATMSYEWWRKWAGSERELF